MLRDGLASALGKATEWSAGPSKESDKKKSGEQKTGRTMSGTYAGARGEHLAWTLTTAPKDSVSFEWSVYIHPPLGKNNLATIKPQETKKFKANSRGKQLSEEATAQLVGPTSGFQAHVEKGSSAVNNDFLFESRSGQADRVLLQDTKKEKVNKKQLDRLKVTPNDVGSMVGTDLKSELDKYQSFVTSFKINKTKFEQFQNSLVPAQTKPAQGPVKKS
jgi:hypothetical protein